MENRKIITDSKGGAHVYNWSLAYLHTLLHLQTTDIQLFALNCSWSQRPCGSRIHWLRGVGCELLVKNAGVLVVVIFIDIVISHWYPLVVYHYCVLLSHYTVTVSFSWATSWWILWWRSGYVFMWWVVVSCLAHSRHFITMGLAALAQLCMK